MHDVSQGKARRVRLQRVSRLFCSSWMTHTGGWWVPAPDPASLVRKAPLPLPHTTSPNYTCPSLPRHCPLLPPFCPLQPPTTHLLPPTAPYFPQLTPTTPSLLTPFPTLLPYPPSLHSCHDTGELPSVCCASCLLPVCLPCCSAPGAWRLLQGRRKRPWPLVNIVYHDV